MAEKAFRASSRVAAVSALRRYDPEDQNEH
jgi:hypothetical protein